MEKKRINTERWRGNIWLDVFIRNGIYTEAAESTHFADATPRQQPHLHKVAVLISSTHHYIIPSLFRNPIRPKIRTMAHNPLKFTTCPQPPHEARSHQ